MWLQLKIVVDHHLLAGISLSGIVCDVMGGIYLAYDLLGGSNGPLRVITRIFTYILIFSIGYALPLGLTFGLIAGIGLGIALGLEFRHLNADRPLVNSRRPLLFGCLRGFSFGVAAVLAFGWVFGLAFGLLASVGLVSIYLLGFSPTREFQPSGKPHIRSRALLASLVRGLSTGMAGAIAGFIADRGIASLLFGLEVGLVVGVVSAIVSIFSPFIEWWASNLPARRLGAYGTILLLFGLILQSIQYWVALFDLPLR
jgi:hypothetical protein